MRLMLDQERSCAFGRLLRAVAGTMARYWLSATWLALAIGIAGLAGAAVADLLPEGFQIRFGISWTEFVPATVALVCGLSILHGTRYAAMLALTIAAGTGIYACAYIVFGGEGHPAMRLFAPTLLLALSAATWMHARRVIRK